MVTVSMPMSSTSAFAALNAWAESQLSFLKALDGPNLDLIRAVELKLHLRRNGTLNGLSKC